MLHLVFRRTPARRSSIRIASGLQLLQERVRQEVTAHIVIAVGTTTVRDDGCDGECIFTADDLLLL